MEKIARLSLTKILFLLSVIALIGQQTKSLAQIRGQGTEPFFDRGNQQIEREIQRLQNRQEQLEQKDQALELENQENIDNKNPENTQGESVPSNDLDSNSPDSSNHQIEVKSLKIKK